MRLQVILLLAGALFASVARFSFAAAQGAPSPAPPLFIAVNASPLAAKFDLTRTQPTDGTFIAGSDAISYYGFVGYSPGDFQRSQVLIKSTSRYDGTKAEYPMLIDYDVKTGFVPQWASHRYYRSGTLINANNYIWKASVGGTSAASGIGPVHPSGGAPVIDGSITWVDQCFGTCNAKVALGATTVAEPGAGFVWAGDFDTVLRPGTQRQFAIGIESDLGNYSGPCALGTQSCDNIFLYGSTKYTSTSAIEISTSIDPGAAAGTKAYHYGIRLVSPDIADTADFSDWSNGPNGLEFASFAKHATSTINDASTSPTFAAVNGTYGYAALVLQNAKGGGANFGIAMATGQAICYATALDGCLVTDAGRNLQYKVAGRNVSGLNANGTFHETLTTPASSSARCSPGDFTDDANYHYVCVAHNTWRRVALSAF